MPSPTATSTITPTATITPRPTRTSIPTETPVLPTPAYSDWTLPDDFLLGAQTADCQLPCWQGLWMGESGPDEIQRMFETTFGFSSQHDFFPDQIVIEGEYFVSRRWIVDEQKEDLFGLSVSTNSDTYLLRGISFGWSGTRFQQYLTPWQVIKELGPPTFIYAAVTQGERYMGVGRLDLLVIYREGMTFYFERTVPVLQSQNASGEYELRAELCPTDAQWSLTPHPTKDFAFLTEPFPEEPGSPLSTIQKHALSFRDRLNSLEKFEVTIDEFVDVAEEQDRCLYLEL
jgi:hypothetical protein